MYHKRGFGRLDHLSLQFTNRVGKTYHHESALLVCSQKDDFKESGIHGLRYLLSSELGEFSIAFSNSSRSGSPGGLEWSLDLDLMTCCSMQSFEGCDGLDGMHDWNGK